MEYLYVMECVGRYKVGISSEPEKRVRQIAGSQPPGPVQLVYAIGSHLRDEVAAAEKAIHAALAHYSVHGEWFEFADEESYALEEAISEEVAKFTQYGGHILGSGEFITLANIVFPHTRQALAKFVTNAAVNPGTWAIAQLLWNSPDRASLALAVPPKEQWPLLAELIGAFVKYVALGSQHGLLNSTSTTDQTWPAWNSMFASMGMKMPKWTKDGKFAGETDHPKELFDDDPE